MQNVEDINDDNDNDNDNDDDNDDDTDNEHDFRCPEILMHFPFVSWQLAAAAFVLLQNITLSVPTIL